MRRTNDEDRSVSNWTIRESLDLYHVLNWGSGFFAINDAGDVEIRPKTSLEESARLLERYEQGLKGYTGCRASPE